jgi:hypothetical protein
MDTSEREEPQPEVQAGPDELEEFIVEIIDVEVEAALRGKKRWT